ncbi:MAG: hypothetical protein IPF92_02615 [Myxococcales bacterium]|nr:hypothetical protein [Myxococcales bacterium]MBL0197314.1 hypothetical protein [Myxococcales bacterium]
MLTAKPAVVVSLVALGVALVPALAAGLTGCGPSRCGAQCPADPEPTEAQRNRCEANVSPAPACQAELVALGDCSTGLTVCGRDDRTDLAATAQVVLKECGPQLVAYTDCTSRVK